MDSFCGTEMFEKPFGGELSNALQSSRLFEQMRCARDDGQLLLATQRRVGFHIQFDDLRVMAAYNQKRGRLHLGQGVSRQVRSSTSRNDRTDAITQLGRSNQRGRSASTGSKIADGQPLQDGL